eukprot:4289387-Prymnesium_polylepis.1
MPSGCDEAWRRGRPPAASASPASGSAMNSGRESDASTGALRTISSHLKPSSTSGPTVRPPSLRAAAGL